MLQEFIKKWIPEFNVKEYGVVSPASGGNTVLTKSYMKTEEPNVVGEKIVEVTPEAANLSEDNIEVTTQVREIKEKLPDGSIVYREQEKTIIRPKIPKPQDKKAQQDRCISEFIQSDLPSYNIEDAKTETQKLKDGGLVFKKIFKKKPGVNSNEADVVEEIVELDKDLNEKNCKSLFIEKSTNKILDKNMHGDQIKKSVHRTVVRPKKLENLSEEVLFLKPFKLDDETLNEILPTFNLNDYHRVEMMPDGSAVLLRSYNKPSQPTVVVEEVLEIFPCGGQKTQVINKFREINELMPNGAVSTRELRKKLIKPYDDSKLPKKDMEDKIIEEFQLDDIPNYIVDNNNVQVKRDGDGIIRVKKVYHKNNQVANNQADIVEEVVELVPLNDQLDDTDLLVEVTMKEAQEKNSFKVDKSKIIRKTIIKPKVVFETVAKTNEREEFLKNIVFEKILKNVNFNDYETKTSDEDKIIWYRKETEFSSPGSILEDQIEFSFDAANSNIDDLEVLEKKRDIKEKLPDGSFAVRTQKKLLIRPKKTTKEKKWREQNRYFDEFLTVDFPSYKIETAKTETKSLEDGAILTKKVFKRDPKMRNNEVETVEELVIKHPGIQDRSESQIDYETYVEEFDEKNINGETKKKMIRKTIIKPKENDENNVIEEFKKTAENKVVNESGKNYKMIKFYFDELIRKKYPEIDVNEKNNVEKTTYGGYILKKKFVKPGKKNVVVEKTVETSPEAANLSEDNIEVTTQVREIKEQLPDGSIVYREQEKTIIRPKIQKPQDKKAQQDRFISEFIQSDLPSYNIEDAKTETQKLKDGGLVFKKIFKKKPGVNSNEADVVEEIVETTAGVDETSVDVIVETITEEVQEKVKGGKTITKVIRKTIVKPKTISEEKKVVEPKKGDEKVQDKPTPVMDTSTMVLVEKLIPQIDTKDFEKVETSVDGGSVLKKTFVKPGKKNVVVEKTVETSPEAANLSEDNIEVTTQVREIKEQLPDGSIVYREQEKTIIRPKIQKPQDKKAQQDRFISEFIQSDLPSYNIEDAKTETQKLKDGGLVFKKIFKKKPGVNSNEADVVEEIVETTAGVDETSVDVIVETITEEVQEKVKGGKTITKVIRKTIVKPKTISEEKKVVEPKKGDEKVQDKPTPVMDTSTMVLVEKLIPQIDTKDFEKVETSVDGGSVLKKTFVKPGKKNVVVEKTVETSPEAANLSEDNIEVTTQVREIKEQLPDGSIVYREQEKTIIRPKIQKPQDKKAQQDRFISEFIQSDLPSYNIEDAKTETQKLKDGGLVFKKIFKKKPGVNSNEADVVEEIVETTAGVDETSVDVIVETITDEVQEKVKGGKTITKVIRKTIVKPKTISEEKKVVEPKKGDEKVQDKPTPVMDTSTMVLVEKLIPQIDTKDFEKVETSVDGGSVLKKTFVKPGKKNVVVEKTVETSPEAASLSEDNIEVTTQVREIKEQLPDGSIVYREQEKTIIRPKIQKPQDKKAQQDRFISEFIQSDLPSYNIEDAKTETQKLKDGGLVFKKIFKKKPGVNSNEADVVEEIVETTAGVDETSVDVIVETITDEVQEKVKGGKTITKVIRKTIVKPKTISEEKKVVEPKKGDEKVQDKPTPVMDTSTMVLVEKLIPQIDTKDFEKVETSVDGGSVLKKTFVKPGKKNVVVEKTVETSPEAANLSEDNIEVTTQVREIKEQLPDGSIVYREQEKTIIRPKIQKPQDKKAQQDRFISEFIQSDLPSYNIEDAKTETQKLKDGGLVFKKIFKKKPGVNSNEADVVEEIVETTAGVDETSVDVIVETITDEVQEKVKGGKTITKVIRKTIVKPKTISEEKKVVEPKKGDEKVQDKPTPVMDTSTMVLVEKLIPQIDTKDFEKVETSVDGGSVLKKTFVKPGKKNVVVEKTVETSPEAASLSEDNIEVTTQVREIKEQLPDGSIVYREQEKTIIRPKIQKPQDKKAQQDRFISEFIQSDLPSYNIEDAKTETQKLKDGGLVFKKIFKKKPGVNSNEADVVEEIVETTAGVDETSVDVIVETITDEVQEKVKGGKTITKVIRKTIVKPKTISEEKKVVEPKKGDEKVQDKPTPVMDTSNMVLVEKLIPQIDTKDFEKVETSVDGGSVLKKTFVKPGKKNVVVEKTVETSPEAASLSEDNIEVTTQVREIKEQLPDGSIVYREQEKTIIRPKIQKPQDKKAQQDRFISEFIQSDLPSYNIEDAKTETQKLKDGGLVFKKIFKKKPGVNSNEADVVEEIVETTAGVDETSVDVIVETITDEVQEKVKGGKTITKVIRKTIVKPKTISEEKKVVEPKKGDEKVQDKPTPVMDTSTMVLVEKLIPQIDTKDFEKVETSVDGGSVLKKTFVKPGKKNVVVEKTVETSPEAASLSEDNIEVTTQVREIKEQLPDGSIVYREQEKTIIRPKIQKPQDKKAQQDRFISEFIQSDLPSYNIEDAKTETQKLKDGGLVFKKIFKKKPGVNSNEADVVEEIVETTAGVDETSVDVIVETITDEVQEKVKGGKTITKVIRKTIVKPKTISEEKKVVEPKKGDEKVQDKPTPVMDTSTMVLVEKLIPQIDTKDFEKVETSVDGGSVLKKTFVKPGKKNVVVEKTVETSPEAASLSEDNIEVTTQVREIKEQLPDGSIVYREQEKTIIRPKIQKPQDKKAQQDRFISEFIQSDLPSYNIEDAKTETQKLKDGGLVFKKIFKKKPGVNSNEADVVEEIVETTAGVDETSVDVIVETITDEVQEKVKGGKTITKVIRKTIVKPKTISEEKKVVEPKKGDEKVQDKPTPVMDTSNMVLVEKLIPQIDTKDFEKVETSVDGGSVLKKTFVKPGKKNVVVEKTVETSPEAASLSEDNIEVTTQVREIKEQLPDGSIVYREQEKTIIRPKIQKPQDKKAQQDRFISEFIQSDLPSYNIEDAKTETQKLKDGGLVFKKIFKKKPGVNSNEADVVEEIVETTAGVDETSVDVIVETITDEVQEKVKGGKTITKVIRKTIVKPKTISEEKKVVEPKKGDEKVQDKPTPVMDTSTMVLVEKLIPQIDTKDFEKVETSVDGGSVLKKTFVKPGKKNVVVEKTVETSPEAASLSEDNIEVTTQVREIKEQLPDGSIVYREQEKTIIRPKIQKPQDKKAQQDRFISEFIQSDLPSYNIEDAKTETQKLKDGGLVFKKIFKKKPGVNSNEADVVEEIVETTAGVDETSVDVIVETITDEVQEKVKGGKTITKVIRKTIVKPKTISEEKKVVEPKKGDEKVQDKPTPVMDTSTMVLVEKLIPQIDTKDFEKVETSVDGGSVLKKTFVKPGKKNVVVEKTVETSPEAASLSEDNIEVTTQVREIKEQLPDGSIVYREQEKTIIRPKIQKPQDKKAQQDRFISEFIQSDLPSYNIEDAKTETQKLKDGGLVFKKIFKKKPGVNSNEADVVEEIVETTAGVDETSVDVIVETITDEVQEKVKGGKTITKVIRKTIVKPKTISEEKKVVEPKKGDEKVQDKPTPVMDTSTMVLVEKLIPQIDTKDFEKVETSVDGGSVLKKTFVKPGKKNVVVEKTVETSPEAASLSEDNIEVTTHVREIKEQLPDGSIVYREQEKTIIRPKIQKPQDKKAQQDRFISEFIQSDLPSYNIEDAKTETQKLKDGGLVFKKIFKKKPGVNSNEADVLEEIVETTAGVDETSVDVIVETITDEVQEKVKGGKTITKVIRKTIVKPKTISEEKKVVEPKKGDEKVQDKPTPVMDTSTMVLVEKLIPQIDTKDFEKVETSVDGGSVLKKTFVKPGKKNVVVEKTVETSPEAASLSEDNIEVTTQVREIKEQLPDGSIVYREQEKTIIRPKIQKPQDKKAQQDRFISEFIQSDLPSYNIEDAKTETQKLKDGGLVFKKIFKKKPGVNSNEADVVEEIVETTAGVDETSVDVIVETITDEVQEKVKGGKTITKVIRKTIVKPKTISEEKKVVEPKKGDEKVQDKPTPVMDTSTMVLVEKLIPQIDTKDFEKVETSVDGGSVLKKTFVKPGKKNVVVEKTVETSPEAASLSEDNIEVTTHVREIKEQLPDGSIVYREQEKTIIRPKIQKPQDKKAQQDRFISEFIQSDLPSYNIEDAKTETQKLKDGGLVFKKIFKKKPGVNSNEADVLEEIVETTAGVDETSVDVIAETITEEVQEKVKGGKTITKVIRKTIVKPKTISEEKKVVEPKKGDEKVQDKPTPVMDTSTKVLVEKLIPQIDTKDFEKVETSVDGGSVLRKTFVKPGKKNVVVEKTVETSPEAASLSEDNIEVTTHVREIKEQLPDGSIVYREQEKTIIRPKIQKPQDKKAQQDRFISEFIQSDLPSYNIEDAKTETQKLKDGGLVFKKIFKKKPGVNSNEADVLEEIVETTAGVDETSVDVIVETITDEVQEKVKGGKTITKVIRKTIVKPKTISEEKKVVEPKKGDEKVQDKPTPVMDTSTMVLVEKLIPQIDTKDFEKVETSVDGGSVLKKTFVKPGKKNVVVEKTVETSPEAASLSEDNIEVTTQVREIKEQLPDGSIVYREQEKTIIRPKIQKPQDKKAQQDRFISEFIQSDLPSYNIEDAKTETQKLKDGGLVFKKIFKKKPGVNSNEADVLEEIVETTAGVDETSVDVIAETITEEVQEKVKGGKTITKVIRKTIVKPKTISEEKKVVEPKKGDEKVQDKPTPVMDTSTKVLVEKLIPQIDTKDFEKVETSVDGGSVLRKTFVKPGKKNVVVEKTVETSPEAASLSEDNIEVTTQVREIKEQLPDGSIVYREQEKTIIRPKIQKPQDKKAQQDRFISEFIQSDLPSYNIEDAKTETQKLKDGGLVFKKIFKKKPGVNSNEADVLEEIVETTAGVDETSVDVIAETITEEVQEKVKGGKTITKVIRKTIVKPKTISEEKKVVEPKKGDEKVQDKPTPVMDTSNMVLVEKLIPQIDTKDFEKVETSVDGGSVLKKTFVKPGKKNVVVEKTVETSPEAASLSEDNIEVTTQVREIKEQLPDGSIVYREQEKTIIRPKIQKPQDKKAQQDRFISEFIQSDLPSYNIEDAKTETQKLKDGGLVFKKIFKKKPGVNSNEADVLEEIVETTAGVDETSVDVIAETITEEVQEKVKGGKTITKVIRKTIVKPKTISEEKKVVEPKKGDEKVQDKPTPVMDTSTKVLVEKLIPQIDTKDFEKVETSVDGGSVLRKTFVKPGKKNVVVEKTVETSPEAASLSEDNIEVTTQVREIKEQLPDGSIVYREQEKTIIRPKIQKPQDKKAQQDRFISEFIQSDLPSYNIEDAKTETQKLKDGGLVFKKIFKKKPGVNSNEADVLEEIVETTAGVDETSVDVIAETITEEVQEKVKGGKTITKVIRKTIVKPKTISEEKKVVEPKKGDEKVQDKPTPVMDTSTKVLVEKLIPQIDTKDFEKVETSVDGGSVLRKTFVKPGKKNVVVEKTVETSPEAASLSEDNIEVTTQVREIKEQLPDGSIVYREQEKTIIRPKIQKPQDKKAQQDRFISEFIQSDLPSYNIEDAKTETQKLKDGGLVFKKIFKKKPGVNSNEADVLEEIVETTAGVDETSVDVIAETITEEVQEKVKGGKTITKVIRKTIVKPKTISEEKKVVEPKKGDEKVQDKPTPVMDTSTKVLVEKLIPQIDTKDFEKVETSVDGGSVLRKTFVKPGKKNVVVEKTVETSPEAASLSEDNIEVTTQVREIKEQLPDGSIVYREQEKTIIRPKIQKPQDKKAQQDRFISEFIQSDLPSYNIEDAKTETQKLKDGGLVFKKIFKKKPGVNSNEADVLEEIVETTAGVDETSVDVIAETITEEVQEKVKGGKTITKVIRKTIVKPKTISEEKKVVEPKKGDEKVQDKPTPVMDTSTKVLVEKLIPQIDTKDSEKVETSVDGGSVLKKTFVKPGKKNVVVEKTVETSPEAASLSEDNIEVTTQVREIKEQLPDGSIVYREQEKTIIRPKIQKPQDKKAQQDRFISEFIQSDLPSYNIEDAKTETQKLKDGGLVFKKIFKKKPGVNSNEADVLEEIVETTAGVDETSVDVIAETITEEVQEKVKGGKTITKVIRKTIVKPKTISEEKKVVEPKKGDEKVQDKPTPVMDTSTKVLVEKLIPQIDTKDFEKVETSVDGGSVLRKTFVKPGKKNVVVEKTVETSPEAASLSEDNIEVTTQVREIKEQLPDGSIVYREQEKTIIRPKIQKPQDKKAQQDRFISEFIQSDLPSYNIEDAKTETQKLKDGGLVFKKIFKKKPGVNSNEADVLEEIVETTAGVDETSVDVIAETITEEVQEKVKGGKTITKVIRKTIVKPKTISEEKKVVEPKKGDEKVQDKPTPVMDTSTKVLVEKLIPQIDTKDFEKVETSVDGGSVLRKTFVKPGKKNVVVEKTVETSPEAANLSEDNIEVTTQVREIKEQLPDGSIVYREQEKLFIGPKTNTPFNPQSQVSSLISEFKSSNLSCFDESQLQTKSETLSSGNLQITNLYPKVSSKVEPDEEEYYYFEEIIEISYTITFEYHDSISAFVSQKPSTYVLADGSVVPILQRITFITPLLDSTNQSQPQVNPSHSELSVIMKNANFNNNSLLFPHIASDQSSFSTFTDQNSLCTNNHSVSPSNDEFELGEKWSVINKVNISNHQNKHFRNVMHRTVDEHGEIVEQLISEEYLSDQSLSSSTHSSLENLILSDEVEQPDGDFQALTVFTHTLEDDPVYETETSEYQDVLPDGTLVKRRVTKTNKTQSVVKRVILEGFDQDEPFSDLGSSTLVPITTSDQSFTRYCDHTSTEPEVNTDVQLSEEQLKDGTILRKRITNTKTQQLTTERLVVGGCGLFSVAEGGEDDVLRTLKQLSITRTSTGSYHFLLFVC